MKPLLNGLSAPSMLDWTALAARIKSYSQFRSQLSQKNAPETAKSQVGLVIICPVQKNESDLYALSGYFHVFARDKKAYFCASSGFFTMSLTLSGLRS